MNMTDKVNGIVMINTNDSHLPDHYSPDHTCPDSQYGKKFFKFKFLLDRLIFQILQISSLATFTANTAEMVSVFQYYMLD